ncbi:unnamed protein product (macronuclear) [Paramecium tetraurelia]|uniref:IQ calmodulin-binding motif family protein n=1 Tax=Paramecium tetraurelia TaxID=5888 RepID=A0CW59_PARTE|nr:uncharacterized protein GSPATT00001228001 [Paramecium tetraurelia]CAK75026.1 unnamed protein product [Paramecium tetraurelia]|eukprot:XP_001442423.1 hypothetical protein (macronuclear) [Paramecium tetraurelia strain d4-2]
MNIQLAHMVVSQWRSFVNKRKEVRAILIAQYKPSYIRVLQSYKEMKRRRFQQYIINNASNLIYKALKINLWKVKHLKQFLNQNQVKRFYILKSQEQIFQNTFNLHAKEVNVKTIRLHVQSSCQYKNLIPLLFHKIKSAVILFNCHQLKKTFGETNINKDVIKYEFLYNFIKYVKVKLPIKQFVFTNQERTIHQELLKRIDKFQLEEYNLLKYIELDNPKILKKVYQYNSQNRDRQLHIFFDFQLKELAAVCRIQKYFRAKKDIASNGMKYQAIMKLINQSRAVYVIQRWFRRIRWNHRNNFFKEISFYVSQIPNSNLYLDMEIYSKIQEIAKSQQHSLKFLEQYNTIVADNQSARLQFKSKSFDDSVQSTYVQSLALFDLLNVPIVPNWLIREIQMVYINEDKLIDYSVIKQEQIQTKWNCRNREYLNKNRESLKELQYEKPVDIYGLLHFGASISFDYINNRDYIKFTYVSTSEAKYRVIALALLTYRFKFNGTSILMFGDNIWEGTQQQKTTFLSRYYQKIQKIYQVEIQTLEKSQLYNGKQNQVILCLDNFQAEKFKFDKQTVQLQFFNEKSRIIENFIWMCPELACKQKYLRNQVSIQLNQNSLKNSSHIQQANSSFGDIQQDYKSFIQKFIPQQSLDISPQSGIIDGSSNSTQVPLKFSIMCLENAEIQFQQPKFKRRTEQSNQEFVMTSRFRTQNNSLNNSKIKEQNDSQNYSCIQPKRRQFPLEDINEHIEYSQLKQQQQEMALIENKEKIVKIKQKNLNEKTFIREFQNFASLLQRQEQKIMKNQMRTARNNTLEKSQKTESIKQTIKSQSVTRREDYQDVSIVFPKIEPKCSKKQTINSRLSNYHRYAVFPEELYAISTKKDTFHS